MLKRFTDNYNKSPNSNMGKLLSILHSQMKTLTDTFDQIDKCRDIDNAMGLTLDLAGGNVGQLRGAATDEIFRILIKSKIARNLSKSDVNTIIDVLSISLDCSPSDIRIREKFEDPLDPEPAAISLIKVPVAKINEVGMSPIQFAQIVQKTVAGGVRVAQIDLSGTYRLSSKKNDIEKSEFGLADVEMTTGGTLGMVYVPGKGYDLPI